MENQYSKILWDFNIRADRFIKARGPNIVLADKKNQEAFIIDVSIPANFLVRDKEAKEIRNNKTFH